MDTRQKKLESISQSLYEQKVLMALNAQPIRKTVLISEIKIVDINAIEWSGNVVKMTDAAFNQFCKIIGVPVTFQRKVGDLFDEQKQINFLNNIRKAVAQADSGKTVTLVVNKIERKIVGVMREDRQLISNKGFLDTVGQVVDKGKLIVNEFAVNDKTGEIIINTTNPNGLFDIEGVKDETHIGGVSFSNSMKNGFLVTPYTNRLVCTNGMIVKGFDDDDINMTNIDHDSMNNFWNKLKQLMKNGFKPLKFDERALKAMNTPSSLDEMEKATRAIMNTLSNQFEVKDIQSWIPLQETLNRFHAAGIDTQSFNSSQFKNARTGTSVWDIIQSITHFSSHDNGFNLTDYARMQLQMAAGQLFGKASYDMENVIASPFNSLKKIR